MMTGSDWTNVISPLNTSGDEAEIVSPLDVLLVVNELNTPSIHDPQTGQLPAAGQNNAAPPPFFDANCDSFVTSLDALLIINVLNGEVAPTAWKFSEFGSSFDRIAGIT